VVDALKDFAQSTVTLGPSPATSGTTATISNPSIYPVPPFDLTFWAPNSVPSLATAEITRCTNLSAGVATITRNAYGYGVQAIAAGWSCGQLVTAHLLGQLASGGGLPYATVGTGIDYGTGGPLGGAYPGQEIWDLPYDAVGFTAGNFQRATTLVPQTVGGEGQLINAGPTASVGNIDTTNDAYDLIAAIAASDMTGSQVLLIFASTSIPQVGPGQSGSIDWTMSSASPLVGTDLVWVPSTGKLTSTAGGTFILQMHFSGGWN